MALKINLTSTAFGVPAPEAYVRVLNFNGDKNHMMAMVATYYDAESATSGARALDQKPYQFAVGQINTEAGEDGVLAGIYNCLKTLPEFSGATNC
jgi:hypothetical protein